MHHHQSIFLLLAVFVLFAGCMPVEESREKRGVILSALGGGALGAIVGAFVPKVSAGQGAAAGAALGGAYSYFFKGKTTTTTPYSSDYNRNQDYSDNTDYSS